MLERLNAEHPDFRVDIPRLRILQRTYTGVGSYTEFAASDKLLSPERKAIQLDVAVTLPNAKTGLGVVFFLDRMQLTLELFSYDDTWDGVYEGFSIRRIVYDVVSEKGKFGGRIEGRE